MEIAIVIVIVSVLLTMGIAALNAQIASSAIAATKKKQAVIQDTLTSYLGLHNRLPCPDTDYLTQPDGIENRTNGGTPAIPPDPTQLCLLSYGILPYATLGLPPDAASDGWDNYFSYYISNTPNSFDWTLSTNFQTGNQGRFNVYSTNGLAAPLASTALRTGAVVVIVSHGRNGNGAITAQGTPNTAPALANDEYLNTIACKANVGSAPNCTAVDFWKRDVTDNNAALGGLFDDVVLYLGPGDLVSPLTKDGTLQGPTATTKQTLSNLSDAIVQAIISTGSGTVAPPNIVALPFDAWGNQVLPLVWGPNLAIGKKIGTFCVPTDPAYTLSSAGPDGIAGNADDVIFVMPVSTMIRLITLGGATPSTNVTCGM